VFTPQEEWEQINEDCRVADIGCVDCKRKLANNLNKHLEPFREKRAKLEKDPGYVKDVLFEGAKQAKEIAAETMDEVRSAIGFYGLKGKS
jgi:tryptophanyl-tRNA synthetase